MKIKSILASLQGKEEKKKRMKNLTVESEKDQTFVVVAYRDQSYIYLVSDSSKISLFNFLELKIPSLVVGEDQVLRVSELADTISDAIEVFMHENNIGMSLSDLPAIVLLEPSRFCISCIDIESLETYTEAIKKINSGSLYEIFAQSPYIENDTCYEPFTVSNDDDKINRLNIMYSSKSFLKSWSKVIEEIGLKVAYIGSASSPLLMDLAEGNSHPCILVDMQKLSSKIYCINGKKEPIIELKFPYGYMQYISRENGYEYRRLKARVMATIINNKFHLIFIMPNYFSLECLKQYIHRSLRWKNGKSK